MNDHLAIQLNVFSMWMAYALDPGTVDESINREVDAQIFRQPQLATSRNLLAELLASKSADARGESAALGALRYEQHPTYGPSIASVVGWLIDRNPRRSIDEEIADNLARFAMQTRIDQYPPRVKRVHLPYGDGVRLESARAAPARRRLPVEQRTVFQTVEYHIPRDDPPASLLFVRFMTSNLAHVDHLIDEFEVMIEDLRLSPVP
jgi:hypothetical protein